MSKTYIRKTNKRRARAIFAAALVLTVILTICLLPMIAAALFASPKVAGAGLLMAAGPLVLFKAEGEGGGGTMTDEEFRGKLLTGVKTLQDAHNKTTSQIEALAKGSEANAGAILKLQEIANELTSTMVALKKQALRGGSPARLGLVSDECARHILGVAMAARIRSGKQIENRDRFESIAKDILGAEFRAALTTSDIPLPTVYAGEVAELVSQFGTARLYGTVYPLGAGTVKLPRLGTDTAFGLIASSGTVTEKSPTVIFVTFSAEKFGGVVRVPSEIDEDSIVAMGQFIARYSARQIASVEDANFWAGTGAASGVNGTAEGLTKNTITNSKVVQMASTKTHYSDVTLAYIRQLRSVPDEAAIRMGAYYAHTSFEQLFAGLNTAGDKPYIANGVNGASLDGFPIRWIPSLPAYSTGANASKVFILFGDVTWQYLGVRGGIRFDTSLDAAFVTDEILIRALERFTLGLMALGAVAGLETAAS